MCTLIEVEEGLPYSHAGVLSKDERGNWIVLESWNRVQSVPLSEFLSHRRVGTTTLVRRPIFKNADRGWIQRRFETHFEGLRYDPAFLWGNSDSLGETYYCSEFVTKFLNPKLLRPIQTKPMHFQKYRDYWVKYFGKTPPDGEPGVSPSDLARTDSMITVGALP